VNNTTLILAIAGLSTLGVIARPLRVPEYVWAVIGSAVLVAFGLLS
jgi:arsenical pump membrane protein